MAEYRDYRQMDSLRVDSSSERMQLPIRSIVGGKNSAHCHSVHFEQPVDEHSVLADWLERDAHKELLRLQDEGDVAGDEVQPVSGKRHYNFVTLRDALKAMVWVQVAAALRILGASHTGFGEDGRPSSGPLLPDCVVDLRVDHCAPLTDHSASAQVPEHLLQDIGYTLCSAALPCAVREGDPVVQLAMESHFTLLSLFEKNDGGAALRRTRVVSPGHLNLGSLEKMTVLLDALFGSIINRFLGNTQLSWQYAAATGKSLLPRVSDARYWLRYLFNHAPCKEPKEWVSDQHKSSLPRGLYTPEYFKAFVLDLADQFAYFLLEAKNASGPGRSHDMATVVRYFAGDKIVVRAVKREEVVEVLVDVVMPLLPPGLACPRLTWLMNVALADCESVFLFPFGLPERVYTGYGSNQGSKLVSDLGDEDDPLDTCADSDFDCLEDSLGQSMEAFLDEPTEHSDVDPPVPFLYAGFSSLDTPAAPIVETDVLDSNADRDEHCDNWSNGEEDVDDRSVEKHNKEPKRKTTKGSKKKKGTGNGTKDKPSGMEAEAKTIKDFDKLKKLLQRLEKNKTSNRRFLLVLGLTVVGGAVAVLCNHRPLCLNDAEQMLCKIYLLRALVLPNRVCSDERVPHRAHCHPLFAPGPVPSPEAAQNHQTPTPLDGVRLRLRKEAIVRVRALLTGRLKHFSMPDYFREPRELRAGPTHPEETPLQ